MPKTDTNLSTYTSMMRVTSTGRPFTKDLYDMFVAVLLQVNLCDHRVMFRTYAHTFSTDEAAKVMSQLVFIHIHRKPDPKDVSRQIATRTTTTFSMDNSSAKTLLQQFLSAKLIMNATDPSNWIVRDKGIWCLTLKGKFVMEEFTDSTQIEMSTSLIAALNASHMTTNISGNNRIITLDRLADNDDQITFSRTNMTTVFRAMMASLPRETLLMDDFSGIDFSRHQYPFLGHHCIDWLCERLTINSRDEAETVASQFVLFGWVARVHDKSARSYIKDENMTFISARNSVYYVTERGCIILGWNKTRTAVNRQQPRPTSMAISDSAMSHNGSQWARLLHILETPLIRMYFRDFLRANYCEENINFWVDYNKLKNDKAVLEQVADCYTIYETYLGPYATSDVNIDHSLHHEIDKFVSTVFTVVSHAPSSTPYFITTPAYQHTVTGNPSRLLLPQDTRQKIIVIKVISPERCLAKLLQLFARVNDLVCCMMAEDSVPKFVKTQKYKELIAQQQQREQDDSDQDEDGEDSDEDREGRRLVHVSTALSAQRSSMDHQRHKVGTVTSVAF